MSPKKEVTPRARSQVVVAVGYGDVGRARKAALEVAAEQAGKTVSSWALSVLMHAAGKPVERAATSVELSALERRIERLEAREDSKGRG